MAAPNHHRYTGASVAAEVLQSNGYVNQTLIPAQTGYTQTSAYKFATRLSENNYWILAT